MDSYSLAYVLNPRDALYRGRCETFALHDQFTDRYVIKYVDVQSLYPYVCKSKHYPVGHPRCLIVPNFRGLDVNPYDGLIKCKILPTRGLRIPLLPCHINYKLMFRICAETTNFGVCGHTRSERCITDTWVSVELQKAVAIGYVIVEIYEAWNYDETTVYDQATSEEGLFAQYMKIKMEASGYPIECTTPQDQSAFIERVRAYDDITLSYDDIVYNAARRTVAKLCMNNIWGKFPQNPDRRMKEFVTEPRKLFELISDDTYDVSDVQIINDDCLYVTYKKSKEFQTPALNTKKSKTYKKTTN